MTAELRTYRRSLALFCLARSTEPVSAGDLAEYMGTLSQSEGHAESCWRGIDGREVIGILKALADDGLATSGTGQHDSRAGRTTPTWTYALTQQARARVQIPTPPDLAPAMKPARRQTRATAADMSAAPASPYEGLNRDQLIVMLEAQNLYTEEVGRFVSRVGEINSNVRRMLEACGLGERLP